MNISGSRDIHIVIVSSSIGLTFITHVKIISELKAVAVSKVKQGVQRIVVFMVNKSKKYRLWSNMALVLKNKRNFRR